MLVLIASSDATNRLACLGIKKLLACSAIISPLTLALAHLEILHGVQG
jgi:hypothetical protein